MHIVLLVVYVLFGRANCGILYPRETESREVKSLNGLWDFSTSTGKEGHLNEWFKSEMKRNNKIDTILMPVPSSYNDITVDAKLRDFCGYVWYQRTFFVPKSWSDKKVWIRFESVSYSAEVWINGKLSLTHQIGHLPFQAEITKNLKFGKENLVTVACDNTLTNISIPQGEINQVSTDSGIKIEQSYTFDFFNYAGIHRQVVLYTTPKTYVDDIRIHTGASDNGNLGVVYYKLSIIGTENYKISVTLYDENNILNLSNAGGIDGMIFVQQPKLWWPYLMDPNPGHLYTCEVSLLDESFNIIDVYRLPIGIRQLEFNSTGMFINNKPLYLHGFGRHEDSDVRGRGMDLPLILRDYNLIKWVGGNAYRTSHYPYSEEIMDLADRLGIMIIDECPAVNIDLFSEELKFNHMQSITELIDRDKNRPSVIAWSIANEPRSTKPEADEYFKAIANHTRSLDVVRPITGSINADVYKDKMGKHLDIISFNRYNAWYFNDGKLDTIDKNLIENAKQWRNHTGKPVLMSEYGADTLAGFHSMPEYIWSEEFQVKLMSKHFEAFDSLRAEGWFIGEFIWNFADFQTAQTHTRAGGNRKGIFTRNRQPKAAAHHLRRRYFTLARELYNVSTPSDLYNYVANGADLNRDEL